MVTSDPAVYRQICFSFNDLNFIHLFDTLLSFEYRPKLVRLGRRTLRSNTQQLSFAKAKSQIMSYRCD